MDAKLEADAKLQAKLEADARVNAKIEAIWKMADEAKDVKSTFSPNIRSSLSKVIKTKEQADLFMKLLKMA